MSRIRQPITCNDGSAVSIQASSFHYCSPREDGAIYSEVEAGYPDGAIPESWLEFKEGAGSPNESIFPWLPSRLIFDYFALHGGVKSGELPPLRF